MCQNLRLSCPHLMDDDWYARGATGDLMRILDSIPKVQDGIRGGQLYGHWPNIGRPMGSIAAKQYPTSCPKAWNLRF